MTRTSFLLRTSAAGLGATLVLIVALSAVSFPHWQTTGFHPDAILEAALNEPFCWFLMGLAALGAMTAALHLPSDRAGAVLAHLLLLACLAAAIGAAAYLTIRLEIWLLTNYPDGGASAGFAPGEVRAMFCGPNYFVALTYLLLGFGCPIAGYAILRFRQGRADQP